MSLPTHAFFIKDGAIVGVGAANCGWFLTDDTFPKAVIESMENAWFRYTEDFEPSDWTKRDDHFFTTPEALENFDYMVLYSTIIPHNIANKLFTRGYTKEEWQKLLPLQTLTQTDRETLQSYTADARKRIKK